MQGCSILLFFQGLWHVCFWQHFFALSKHLFMQEDNYNDQKGFLLPSSISVLTFTCLCNLHLQRYKTNMTLCLEGHFKKAIKAMQKPTSTYWRPPSTNPRCTNPLPSLHQLLHTAEYMLSSFNVPCWSRTNPFNFWLVFCHLSLLKCFCEDLRAPELQGEVKELEAMGRQRQEEDRNTMLSAWRKTHYYSKAASWKDFSGSKYAVLPCYISPGNTLILFLIRTPLPFTDIWDRGI